MNERQRDATLRTWKIKNCAHEARKEAAMGTGKDKI